MHPEKRLLQVNIFGRLIFTIDTCKIFVKSNFSNENLQSKKGDFYKNFEFINLKLFQDYITDFKYLKKEWFYILLG